MEAKTAARSFSTRGFSVLELLVVITISAVLLSTTYSHLARLMSHYRLDGASRRLLADVQRVRFRAIAERQCFQVKFDSPVPSGSYQLRNAPATGACTAATYADEGSAKKVDSVDLLTVASTANPVFDTRGAVNTTSTITLTSNVGGSRQVIIEATGRMRIN